MQKLYERRTNEYGYLDNPAPIQTEKLHEGMRYNVYVELVKGQEPKTIKLKKPIVNVKVMTTKQNWISATLVAKKVMDTGMVWYLDEEGTHYAYREE